MASSASSLSSPVWRVILILWLALGICAPYAGGQGVIDINAVRPGEPAVNAYARGYNRYPLPQDTVTFSEEAIEAVVAATRYLAEDMADAVQVDDEPLPTVLDVDRGLTADAPRIHPELSDNIRVAQDAEASRAPCGPPEPERPGQAAVHRAGLY